MVAPAPAPAPSPAPTPTPAPPPSYLVWENYVSLLIVILGALPSTLLKGSSSETLQIVGLIASALSAVIGQTNMTSLKKAHMAHLSAFAHAQAANSNAPRVAQAGFVRASLMTGIAMVMALVVGVAGTLSGCPHAGQVVLNAGQCVLDTGVEATVLKDLAQANYVQLIADLASTVGPAIINCVLQAIATENGQGSGSAVVNPPPPNAPVSKAAADSGDVHVRAAYLLQNPTLWQSAAAKGK